MQELIDGLTKAGFSKLPKCRAQEPQVDMEALVFKAYAFGVEQRKMLNLGTPEDKVRAILTARIMFNDSRYELTVAQRDQLFEAAFRGARLEQK